MLSDANTRQKHFAVYSDVAGEGDNRRLVTPSAHPRLPVSDCAQRLSGCLCQSVIVSRPSNDFNIPVVYIHCARGDCEATFHSYPGVFNKTLFFSTHPCTWCHTYQMNVSTLQSQLSAHIVIDVIRTAVLNRCGPREWDHALRQHRATCT